MSTDCAVFLFIFIVKYRDIFYFCIKNEFFKELTESATVQDDYQVSGVYGIEKKYLVIFLSVVYKKAK